MDLKTSYEKYLVNFEELLEQKQIIIQTNLDTSQKGGVKKVLFTKSDVIISNWQASGKQLKIMGKVLIKIVYEDVEEKLQSFDYISDFIENMVTKNVLSDDMCDVRASIVDSDYSILNDEIRIQSVVGIFVAGIKEAEANLLTSVENAIYQKDLEKFQVFERYLNEDAKSEYILDANMRVDSILLFDCKASVVDVKYENNMVQVLGQVVCDVLFISDNKLYSKDAIFTFEKNIETLAKTPEVCPYVLIKDSRLVIEGSDDKNSLKIELYMSIKGALFDIEEKDIIVDLYSSKFDLKVQNEYIPYYIKDGIIVKEEKVNGIIQTDSKSPIKRILSCNVLQNSIISLLSVPGEIVNEGLIVAACIYENADGELLSNQAEIPYTVRIDNRNLVSGCRLEASTLTLSAIPRIKQDNEIEVLITMISSICRCNQNIVQGIESVEVADEKEYNDSAITIYKPAKGESLWDVAKKMGVMMEEIKNQNPDIGNEMSGDENIIIYRELTV